MSNNFALDNVTSDHFAIQSVLEDEQEAMVTICCIHLQLILFIPMMLLCTSLYFLFLLQEECESEITIED